MTAVPTLVRALKVLDGKDPVRALLDLHADGTLASVDILLGEQVRAVVERALERRDLSRKDRVAILAILQREAETHARMVGSRANARSVIR